jgi:hypothetical protein
MQYKRLFIFFFFVKTTLFAQNLHFDFQKNAPDTAITIRECIALLEKEEQKYSEAEQRNTKVMITRLRKIFYSFSSWDKYLIKGVAHIKSPYQNTVEQPVDASIKALEMPMGTTVKLFDAISFPKDSASKGVGLRKNIFSSQEVRLENNSILDMGHVLCGMDASNHRHAIRTPRFLGLPTSSIKVRNNMDAVTWIGDLGSLVAEVYFEKRKKGECSPEKQQELIDVFISSADIVGNTDAYAIAELYDLKSENGKKVSEIFKDYYLSQNADKQQDRYKIFMKTLGFKEGLSAKKKRRLIRRYSDEVSDSAAFYTAVSAKNVSRKNLIKAIPLILKMSINPYAKKVTKLFFEQLENNF